jgi:hypothetical protein
MLQRSRGDNSVTRDAMLCMSFVQRGMRMVAYDESLGIGQEAFSSEKSSTH